MDFTLVSLAAAKYRNAKSLVVRRYTMPIVKYLEYGECLYQVDAFFSRKPSECAVLYYKATVD